MYMSPQIEAMLGYSPEEWAADADMWPKLIHPEDSDRVLKQNEITNRTGAPFDQEYRLTARDGRVVWVRDQAVLLGDDEKGHYWQGVLTDITQRKQAEETLRALLNASPDVAFLMDAGGTILALNEQLARLARRTAEDLIGANIDALLPPDIAQARRGRFSEVVRTGQAARFSDRSQSRWYDNSVYPIFDDEGYVSRMAVFARDITEQVEVVQALRESEEQFRGLADNSPNMIFINQGGRLVYTNAACTEQMGYTQAELLASDFDFMSLIAAEDRALLRQRFVAHAKGEEVAPYEYTMCAKDGQPRFAINATKLIKYGGAPAILGIVTDITERRRAEETLRQLSDTFEAIIQASPLAVTMVDPERKVQLWNPAAERIFGWPAAEVIGGEVPFIPTGEQSQFHGLTDRVYAGETITGVELTRVRRDGTSVDIDLSAAPLRGPQGQVRGIMAVIADITARKRAVRDQSESAEKVRTVFEAVTDGISLVNLDRVFIDGNDAIVRLHGFRDKADLLGKRPLDLIAAVDRARAEADMGVDMRAGRGAVHEYRMLRTDGTEFVGELSTAWLKDEKGAPVGLVGITRDITERKRAEEALARHARELSVLYQTSIDIGAAESATALMETVVRQATELLGGEMGGLYLMEPDRTGLRLVLGYKLPPGIVGTRLALGEGASGRVAQTGEPLIVEDYRNWEGRAHSYDEIPFHHVLGVPLKRGDEVVGVINISDYREGGSFTQEDVRLVRLFADQVAGALENARLLEETTRRAAFQEAIVRVAAALRVAPGRAELMPIILDQLRELLKAQGAGLITDAGAEGWVIQLGKGNWEDLTGRRLPAEAHLVRDTIESGDAFQMASIPEPMVAAWPGVFAAGQSIAVVPLMVEQKAIGALAVSRESAVSADEVRLLTAIAEMAGVALHRAGVMETLEVHVQERTRALAEANDRLKELDRLKSLFVSNVSHELRTPITNVLLYLDLVSQPGKEDKRGMYLSVLKREAERLGSLIEDLLTLSRMDQGAMGLNLELRSLDPVVGEVMAVQRARAEAKGITLNLEPNPEVPPVWIAHQPIIQVFTNLLSNAIAYTPTGGHVSVSSEIAAGDSGDMVAARVHNDGPPIPEEDLPQLFQRFFRGKTGRQSGEPGTGLGLAICREIVERHRGRIEVVSSAERGTTFTVLLPLPSE
jgi:PAS domain S-box-containing protein